MAKIIYRGKKASAIVELRMIISVRTALGTALRRKPMLKSIYFSPPLGLLYCNRGRKENYWLMLN